MYKHIMQTAITHTNITIGVFTRTYRIAHEHACEIQRLYPNYVKHTRSNNKLTITNGSRIYYAGFPNDNSVDAIMGCDYQIIYLIEPYTLSQKLKLWSVLRNRVGEYYKIDKAFKPLVFGVYNGEIELEHKERLIGHK